MFGSCSVKIICVKKFFGCLHQEVDSVNFASVFTEAFSPQDWSLQPRAWMRSISQFSVIPDLFSVRSVLPTSLKDYQLAVTRETEPGQ